MACVPITEQAHMLLRELERQRNRHRHQPAVDIPFGLTAGCTSVKHRLYDIVVRNTVTLSGWAPDSYQVARQKPVSPSALVVCSNRYLLPWLSHRIVS